MQAQDIPVGYCQCGCGEQTSLAPHTNRSRGWRKGEPVRYLSGHSARRVWGGSNDYTVDAATGCWVWHRSLNANGYGIYLEKGMRALAHRVYYEREHGALSGAWTLDHLCRNRACVNPVHLQPVTIALNCRRGAQTRLNWEIVRAIRTSRESNAALGERYGVSKATISNIRAGRRWREGLEASLPKALE